MIRRLTISNYRSLGQDVDLRLGPLTALVGQNGSGKTNVVDALRFLGDCMRLGLEGAITKRHGIGAVRR
ncbi:MAG TPA: AAA family ATPase [Thermoanaerobaculia bacterium]|jgi:AAA15 family ATPase/GTPase